MDDLDKKGLLDDFYQSVFNQLKEELLEFLSKQNPELLFNFTETYQEITRTMKHMQDVFIPLEKRLKKIVDSPSLYEDVYKMRDELMDIKIQLKRLKKIIDVEDK